MKRERYSPIIQKVDVLNEEKKLILRERDDMKDQVSVATGNMRRLDIDHERLNTKYQVVVTLTLGNDDRESKHERYEQSAKRPSSYV